MKKALQIQHLRAEGSVSDGAAVRGASESRFYGFGDGFAQLRVLDASGHRRRLPSLLRCRLDRRRRRRLRSGFGKRAGQETEARAAREPARDLSGSLRQLEAPDRIPDVHDERPVRLRPGRPGVVSDLPTDDLGPCSDDGPCPAVGTDTAKLRAYLLAERVDHAATSSTVPGVTSRS